LNPGLVGELCRRVYAAPMFASGKTLPDYEGVRPIVWDQGELRLLDQRKLPQSHEMLELPDVATAADAIRDMVVRGAPAIGITAAYAIVIAARARYQQDRQNWRSLLQPDLELLAAARPTAVNLAWAIEQMRVVADGIGDVDPVPALEKRAMEIHRQDVEANHEMGRLGSQLITGSCAVLTHCNAGALATGGYGTALGVIRSGFAAGKISMVYADETRPWLQGARLTAWELVQDQIPVTLLTEGAAATLMKQGKIAWVIVGSDRIAANGDVANKIGTYSLAVNARHHGIKFMVAAPTSTVDLSTASGNEIPIEQRPATEVLSFGGQKIAAEGAEAWNPVFDVTPAELVDYIVTEKGVVAAPNRQKILEMMHS
jgi:methylthioribose-1-phosphate isomerase